MLFNDVPNILECNVQRLSNMDRMSGDIMEPPIVRLGLFVGGGDFLLDIPNVIANTPYRIVLKSTNLFQDISVHPKWVIEVCRICSEKGSREVIGRVD